MPILQKDSPLPAMGSAAFTLAAAYQSGVTVISVEQIGAGDVFQCNECLIPPMPLEQRRLDRQSWAAENRNDVGTSGE